MTFECARVTPSSVTSCSGKIWTRRDALCQQHTVFPEFFSERCLCVQIGAGQRGRIKRCAEGSCQPRYMPDHIRCDRAETCWSHNWGPLPPPWLCSPPTFWERCVSVVIGFRMSLTRLTASDALEHILCWEERKKDFGFKKKKAQIICQDFFSFNLGSIVCAYYDLLYAVMCYVGVRRSDCRVS